MNVNQEIETIIKFFYMRYLLHGKLFSYFKKRNVFLVLYGGSFTYKNT